MSLSVLPMFSSKRFIISGLTMRFLIHVECFFVYGVKKCSIFFKIFYFFLNFKIFNSYMRSQTLISFFYV